MNAVLRAAQPLDAGRVGDILWRFQEDTPWMPKLHATAETISFCGAMIEQGLVRVAVEGGRVQGFVARRGEEILSLYLAAEAQGRGLGARLLLEAQGASPNLKLWTFQRNTGAQRFYERHGFVEVERTDGSGNDENLPDIRYRWERRA